jgi:hypothetical protein
MSTPDETPTFVLPPAKGRRPAHNAYAVVRELGEEDVGELWVSAGKAPVGAIKTLRYQHHLLARLVAQGKTLTEINAITGMSGTRVSVLKADPTFAELVEFYSEELKEIYCNVHERMAALGVSVMEELQERFEEEPEKFSKRELMELFALMADRSIPTAKGGPSPSHAQAQASGNPLNLQINFVSPPTQGADPAPAIELRPEPPKGGGVERREALPTLTESPALSPALLNALGLKELDLPPAAQDRSASHPQPPVGTPAPRGPKNFRKPRLMRG